MTAVIIPIHRCQVEFNLKNTTITPNKNNIAMKNNNNSLFYLSFIYHLRFYVRKTLAIGLPCANSSTNLSK